MKKLILFFSALIIVAFFTACEQDSLISTDVTEDVIAEHSLENQLELDPYLLALINSEEESSEIDERCSYNGGMSYSRIDQYDFCDTYRIGANNNPFPPASEMVDWHVNIYHRMNNGQWVRRTQRTIYNKYYLSLKTPTYCNGGKYGPYIVFHVFARGNSCSDWTFIDAKSAVIM